MNHSELIKEVAAQAEVSNGEAEKFVNTLLGVVSMALEKGEDVKLNNLGILKVKTRSARQGRNVRTGEVIQIPASKTVGFSVGAALKKALN